MNVLDEKLNRFTKYKISEQTLRKFIDYLKQQAPVFAPHHNGEASYSYECVENSAEVVLSYPRTMQPLKKYFLPPREVLLNFNIKDNTFSKPEIIEETRIFFAVHSYEMASLKRLDYSFTQGHVESNYVSRRKYAIFVGISYTPDESHFSKSVGIDVEETEGFDLFLLPVGDGYFLLEITDTGKRLVEGFPGLAAPDTTEIKTEPLQFKSKIKYHHNRLPAVFDHVYKSKVWDKYAEICVGCGTCNLLCSTCYCFDIRDEVDLDAEHGTRTRYWDGCMLNTFAEVAGGENFRGSLARRTRHRLYRKFKYITAKSEMLHCVGCGRCSHFCPVGISMTDIVNDLITDYEEKQNKEKI